MTKKKTGTAKVAIFKPKPKTTTKVPPLVIGGLVISEKAVCALVKSANERDALESNRDHWKAKALGFHLALQQQQKGMGRMKKKLDGLQMKIAKLEQRLAEKHENGLNMARRLDAVRSVTDPNTKIVEKKAAVDKKYPTQSE